MAGARPHSLAPIYAPVAQAALSNTTGKPTHYKTPRCSQQYGASFSLPLSQSSGAWARAEKTLRASAAMGRRSNSDIVLCYMVISYGNHALTYYAIRSYYMGYMVICYTSIVYGNRALKYYAIWSSLVLPGAP